MRRAVLALGVVLATCNVAAYCAELSEDGMRQLLRDAQADDKDDPCLPYSFEAFKPGRGSAFEELLYKCDVDMRVKALGPDHPQVAAAIDRLASAYRRERRYRDAATLFEQSLAMKERLLGREAPELLATLEGLGWTYRDDGRLAEAEASLRRALALMARDHPRWSLAGPTYVLATVIAGQRRHAEAERLYRQAIAMWRGEPASDGDLVDPLDGLATTLLAQGKLAETDGVLKRALEILDKRDLPPDHWQRAETVMILAELRQAQKRPVESEALYRQLVSIHGLAPTREAEVLERFALTLRGWGRAAEARPLEVRALAIRDKRNAAVPRVSPGGISTSAWDLFDGMLQIVSKFRGEEHPDVVPHLYLFGYAMQQDRRLEDAELCYKRALAIRERTLGPDDPKVAASLEVLAGLYDVQGRAEKAEPLRVRARAIHNRKP